MEQAWWRSKLDIFYLAWRDSVLNNKHALNTARTAYFSSLKNNNKHNPRFLFNAVANLTQKSHSTSGAPFKANDFLDVFCNRNNEIRTKVKSSSLGSSSKLIIKHISAVSQLVSAPNTFENISLEILSKIVSSSKPTTCVLKPLPAKLFKDLWPALDLQCWILLIYHSWPVLSLLVLSTVVKPLFRNHTSSQDL